MAKHKHCELIEAWANDTSLTMQWYDNVLSVWRNMDEPYVWYDKVSYRIKPIPPSVNWEHIHPDYTIITVDDVNGGRLWHKRMNVQFEDNRWKADWKVDDPSKQNLVISLHGFASFTAGTATGIDAIAHRPKDE